LFNRKQIEIREVLASWGTQVLEQIDEVSMDMSGNYKGLVTQLLPNAVITVDRFHVMKVVNEELDAARRDVKKTVESLSDATAKAQLKAALNQSKYILLKSENDLTQEQQLKLEAIQQVSPLARMHSLKEEFREIFESSQNWADGTLSLLDWLASAKTGFRKSIGTISRWFGEIVGDFEQGTTNGVVEGINNKLKLIKRSGYGFRNFNNFQLRCLICWYFNTSSA
jgi:transposase